MVTIKDIAKESGYAVSTVSRALNNHPDVSPETKAKIQAIVEAHQFVPNNNAKQLKQQVSTNIAIVVKGISNMLFATIIEQMQTKIGAAGYTAAVHYLDEDANEVIEACKICRERKPLGILFLGGNAANFTSGFEQIKVPSVLVTNLASNFNFSNLSSVSVDDCKGGEIAIDCLINHGHKRIGVLGGNFEISDASALRYKGCKNSFTAHNMSFDEQTQYQKARFSYGSAYSNMRKLLDKMPDITAVFAMSDVMAIGAIRAIYDRGLRVPQDISVVGFDGIELAAYCTPKLTTVKQPFEEIADNSVELIINCIHRKAETATNILLDASLSSGESVCCYIPK
ncbi:MAG: LacI family DNA-binding transcriptional regulator [Oscillospiraceae bacterium]|nr:LacI family DNA-binding transcriptional regulator [Oscillospiraceae bacterium]